MINEVTDDMAWEETQWFPMTLCRGPYVPSNFFTLGTLLRNKKAISETCKQLTNNGGYRSKMDSLCSAELPLIDWDKFSTKNLSHSMKHGHFEWDTCKSKGCGYRKMTFQSDLIYTSRCYLTLELVYGSGPLILGWTTWYPRGGGATTVVCFLPRVRLKNI